MSPIKREPTREPAEEPKKDPPSLILPKRTRRDAPHEADPAASPPDVAPVSSPPPAEAEPTPAPEKPALEPEPAQSELPLAEHTPASEPAHETPPAPPAPETQSRFASITSSFKSAYERFTSKFRGEVQPQDEKEYKASWGDVAKNAATGFLSVVASYTGVKIIADLPAWWYQKRFTNPAERQRIKDALAAKETELGDTAKPTAIDQKKAKLEEAINASKFLTKEKKAELLGRLHTTVDEYENKDKTLRTERNEKIAKLLDQAIETRVKNTQILKEALNSALMVTGLSAMRGVAYGAVASYERYKQVAQERAEGKREGGQFNEWVVKGFTETAHNLIGGKADTWIGKGMNFVKGATNVLRVAGFVNLAHMEIAGEGFWSAANPVEQLEKLVQNAEAKGLKQTLIDNVLAQWEPITSAVKTSVDWLGWPGTSANLSERLGESDVSGDLTSTDAAATGAAGAVVEIPEATIEAGLVKKGDGILKILQRQGVEAKAAMEAAREAGIVRADGDTRLTTEAIGRLSIFTETQPNGDIEIKFFDSETDKLLTLEEAREAGFTYESNADVPEPAVASETPPPAEPTTKTSSEPEIPNIFKDSPNVPNALLNGTFHIYTDSAGNLVSIGDDGKTSDFLFHISDALKELDNLGNKNSSEYQFLLEQKKIYENTTFEALYDEDTGTEDQGGADTNDHTDKFKGNKYKGEEGKVIFKYDKKTGEVLDVKVPSFWGPSYEDIESALDEWGLTPKQVKDHFFKGTSSTYMDGTAIDTSHPGRYPGTDRPMFPIQSPENDYRQFVRAAEKLSRQEALLYEMAERGRDNTPEYDKLKEKTEGLEKIVAKNMEKQFKINRRPS